MKQNRVAPKRVIKRLKAQAGVTLMEMIFWIAVTLGVIAFIFFMKNTVVPMVNGWRAGSSASTVLVKINSSYHGANNFSGVSTATIAVRSFYDDRFLNGTTITNIFGGTIDFAPVSLQTNNDAVQMTDNLIPRRSCETYVNNVAADVDRVDVNGAQVKGVGGPINTSVLIQTCNLTDLATIISYKLKSN